MSVMRAGKKVNPKLQAGRRDAFHVPCVLVTCLNSVSASDKVRFLDGKTVELCGGAAMQAIVDPFLKRPVKPGEKFWVMVSPDLVGKKLVHKFEIDGVHDPEEARVKELERELEEYKENDKDNECRDCY